MNSGGGGGGNGGNGGSGGNGWSCNCAGGGQVVEKLKVPLANPDFAPFLQRIRDLQPDTAFIYFPGQQGGTFARQFVERGLDKANIKIIGPGDLTDDDELPGQGDVMLGVITAHNYSAAHPSAANKKSASRKMTR